MLQCLIWCNLVFIIHQVYDLYSTFQHCWSAKLCVLHIICIKFNFTYLENTTTSLAILLAILVAIVLWTMSSFKLILKYPFDEKVIVTFYFLVHCSAILLIWMSINWFPALERSIIRQNLREILFYIILHVKHIPVVPAIVFTVSNM